MACNRERAIRSIFAQSRIECRSCRRAAQVKAESPFGLKDALPELRGIKYCGSHRSKFTTRREQRGRFNHLPPAEGDRKQAVYVCGVSWLGRLNPNLDKHTGQAQGNVISIATDDTVSSAVRLPLSRRSELSWSVTRVKSYDPCLYEPWVRIAWLTTGRSGMVSASAPARTNTVSCS